jgi:hypothetical protein
MADHRTADRRGQAQRPPRAPAAGPLVVSADNPRSFTVATAGHAGLRRRRARPARGRPTAARRGPSGHGPGPGRPRHRQHACRPAVPARHQAGAAVAGRGDHLDVPGRNRRAGRARPARADRRPAARRPRRRRRQRCNWRRAGRRRLQPAGRTMGRHASRPWSHRSWGTPCASWHPRPQLRCPPSSPPAPNSPTS